jgi:hypothetical protein
MRASAAATTDCIRGCYRWKKVAIATANTMGYSLDVAFSQKEFNTGIIAPSFATINVPD